MRKFWILILTVSVLFTTSPAQIRVMKIEKLPLAPGEWSCPTFSPDGKFIYFTTSSYDGIWRYSIATRTAEQITDDPKSGFGFAISEDGQRIGYRRTLRQSPERQQDVIVKDLINGASTLIASGEDLSAPSFAGPAVVYSKGNRTENVSSLSMKTTVLGIENAKIAVVRNGEKVLLDPLNGSYVWPSLSPDKTKLLAYDMTYGTFICDLYGKVLARLGRFNAPTWTRDGRWVVGVQEQDDRYAIIGADLWCISPDGAMRRPLISTNDVIELNPSCSPTENTIAFNTVHGEIYLLTYGEGEER